MWSNAFFHYSWPISHNLDRYGLSSSSSLSSNIKMAADGGETKKTRRWPIGRAFKTFLSFNRPRFGRRGDNNKETTSGTRQVNLGQGLPLERNIVLVTGATGGVGKRVVDILLKKGIRVRALARNRGKALAMLSQGQEPAADSLMEIVQADISDSKTLTPEIFKGVVAVVACTAAIVQPKAGDTENRERYYQGIVFYEPETVDKPKDVDYEGIMNTVNAALKYSDIKGKKLYNCDPAFIDRWKQWAGLDDIVMGGVSESNFNLVPGAGEEGGGSSRLAAVFDGIVTSERGFSNGGFVSIRTRNLNPPLDLTGYEGIKLRIKGDGNRYKFILRDSDAWDGPCWVVEFDTVANEWIDVKLPFTSLIPNMRSQTIPVDQRKPFQLDKVYAIQLMLSKFSFDGKLNENFKEGKFRLVIQSIEAYSDASAKLPSFIYISSAGVTRPNRPGINLDEEPPAVRMNDMLGGILTYKLKGEDAIRESGIPYTIIRPCALTEEPSGMPLLVDQGDTIKGKIGRDDLALVVAEALQNPAASNLTFEIKSTIPFSQTWTEEDRNIIGERKDLANLFVEAQSKAK